MEVLSPLLEDLMLNDEYEEDNTLNNVDPEILNQLPKLQAKGNYKIIQIFTKQNTFNYKKHAIYKYNILELNLEYVTEITTSMENIEHFYFDATDNAIIFNAVDHEEMANYILSNDENYIVLPLSFIYNGTNNGHRAQIIIDKKNYKIYTIDPNGFFCYFDELFNDFTHQYLINIIKQYFDMVFIFLGYEYEIDSGISTKINRTVDINGKKEGQCQSVSLFLTFLVCFFGIEIKEANNLIKSLSDDEFVFLITNFAFYSMNLISNGNFTLKNKH